MSWLLYRRVLRDLWLQRGRAALVLLAMTLGVVGIVWVTSSSAVLSRELRSQYNDTSPTSATIRAEGLSEDLADRVARVQGVAAAETATTVRARVRIGTGDYVPLLLFARQDFASSRIAELAPGEGEWPPPDGSLVLERAAVSLAQAEIGSALEIEVSGGRTQAIEVAGTVHDLGQAPAWQDGIVYAYLTPTTLAGLGLDASPTELRVLVAGDRLDRDHIERVAGLVADELETAGSRVTQVTVLEPGEHPHQSQMDSLLWLQQAFGALALLLSGLLVTTLMAALLASQSRQIGALKAVGARTAQVAASYGLSVTLLGVLAVAVGWPLGWLAARSYIVVISTMLNFDARLMTLSPGLVVGQVAVAVAVPLVAAARPVLRAAAVSPAKAMRDYGVTGPRRPRQDGDTEGRRRSDRSRRPWSDRLPRLPLLALRNTFRRRSRVALATVALGLAGATFLAAMNLTTSLDRTLDAKAGSVGFDIAVELVGPVEQADLAAALDGVPGVEAVEGWLRLPITVGAGRIGSSVPNVYGVPAETQMLDLPLLAGRWLRPGDDRAVVVSHTLAEDYPEMTPGRDVELRVGGELGTWHVVGIVREVAAPPTAWVGYDDLAAVVGSRTTNAARVSTAADGPAAVTAARRAVDRALTDASIPVATIATSAEAQQVVRDHILVIVTFLGLMTLLSILIGGLGLGTTMAVAVIERTREIGVLRAVGASDRAVKALVVMEGATVGGLSWLLSVALAIPVSSVFGRTIGQILLESPLDPAANPLGPVLWLTTVVLFSAVASVLPARRAAAMTVSTTLGYA